MAAEHFRQEVAGPLSDTVLVSNRGPISYNFEAGGLVAGNVAGGLAGSLRPMVAGTGATWVACAMDEADRAAAEAGLMVDDGLRIELVEPEPAVYNLAYNVVSNSMLWFCHHHLFDASRRPRPDRRWLEAWEAYRELNQLFAQRVAKVAPEGGRVLVQDYHLALMGTDLARLRPDLHTVHFTHTPFADPSVLRMLPTSVGTELLEAMAGFGACGFHTQRWEAAYRAGQAMIDRAARGDRPEHGPSSRRCRPIRSNCGPRPPNPRWRWPSPASRSRSAGPIARSSSGSTGWSCRRTCSAASGPSTSCSSRQPERRERVVFVALSYPTREGLPEYLAYHNEVESTVARINERWGTPGWTPIVLEVDDDYPRSLAALSRYDVLLVNPVRDGLNLVAKEGPLVNTRDGVLALSREAGAFDELRSAVLEVNPFDVSGTADVLARALDMAAEERAARAASLRSLILARRPGDWLQDQLDAAR